MKKKASIVTFIYLFVNTYCIKVHNQFGRSIGRAGRNPPNEIPYTARNYPRGIKPVITSVDQFELVLSGLALIALVEENNEDVKITPILIGLQFNLVS